MKDVILSFAFATIVSFVWWFLYVKELSVAKDSLLFPLLLVIFIDLSSGGFLVCFWMFSVPGYRVLTCFPL